jgi:hypothetical protein
MGCLKSCFETFTGFDPPPFDLFRQSSVVQSVTDLMLGRCTASQMTYYFGLLL